MEMPESKYFEYKNFIVSDKRIIKKLTIAYRTWGKLNQDKDNAVLICHGYTNHHHALDKYIGWFNNCLLYTSPSPRDATLSRMPSSA